ncbi:MAG: hypothetical protein ICV69_13440 [Thermoleophilaceae bacterium]|nr:hypothetical protein [Thermoleophilaceae bacterium]
MIQVQIRWVINPFRGDQFAEGWLPAAEAALDYGAKDWSFTRALDGRLDFIQTANFRSKSDFERYWYSETIAEKRVELAGTYQVPVTPSFWEVVGSGEARELGAGAPSPAPGGPL